MLRRTASSATPAPSLLLSAAVVDYIDQRVREDAHAYDLHAQTSETRRAAGGNPPACTDHKERKKRDFLSENRRGDTARRHWLLARRLLGNALCVPDLPGESPELYKANEGEAKTAHGWRGLEAVEKEEIDREPREVVPGLPSGATTREDGGGGTNEKRAFGRRSRRDEKRENARLKKEQQVAQAVLDAAGGGLGRQQEWWKLRQMFDDLEVAPRVTAAFEQAQREQENGRTDGKEERTIWDYTRSRGLPEGARAEPDREDTEAHERANLQPDNAARHAPEGNSEKPSGVSNSQSRMSRCESLRAPTFPSADGASPGCARPSSSPSSSTFSFQPLILTQHAWSHALPACDLYLPSRAPPLSAATESAPPNGAYAASFSASLASSPSLVSPPAAAPRAPVAAPAVRGPVAEFEETQVSLGRPSARQSGSLCQPGSLEDDTEKTEEANSDDRVWVMRVGDLWLPRRLGLPLQKFTEFYKARFAERRLTWHVRLSRMQLVCYPDNNATRKQSQTRDTPDAASPSTLLLNVPAAVGCILLLFNS
ncbi:conserved hypothetical protein [Neospora caninum Liverpool]|uniref:Cullin family profile domain-containing protein n=1 Tax=Neospora caninum (strain Liverpool) TaxID=572307 RepID=F0VCJ9_NEOCL|nr:conserved hypothetical protein [Neospora caninum Liverpool]CBZ51688.1 conserved hypothetical protein [Neospora caninum Liverpool]|eukprot:XP_003881721.1 conserved hypothetical protein [Neospora caninum Liverpool]